MKTRYLLLVGSLILSNSAFASTTCTVTEIQHGNLPEFAKTEKYTLKVTDMVNGLRSKIYPNAYITILPNSLKTIAKLDILEPSESSGGHAVSAAGTTGAELSYAFSAGNAIHVECQND